MYNVSPYAMRNTDGTFIMSGLLATKAQTINTMVLLWEMYGQE